MQPPVLIGIKCPQCSAPMKGVEERRFLCDHCGCETMFAAPQADVDRIATDVARAAAGVDRTAAELAIPRLERERAAIAEEYRVAKAEAARSRTRRSLLTLFVTAVFLTPLLGPAIERKSGAIAALAILGILALCALVFVRPLARMCFGISERHRKALQTIRGQFDDVHRRVEAARSAVRSL
jgi:hypothetical protein